MRAPAMIGLFPSFPRTILRNVPAPRILRLEVRMLGEIGVYTTARLYVALGVGVLAIVIALAFVILKQMGVKSYGMPAGRVVRAGQHLGVVIQTCDPYMPSLKGVSESDKTYSYALWLIPETADGDIRTVRLDRHVKSSDRTHNVGAQMFESAVLWLTIDNSSIRGIEVPSGNKSNLPPPASLINAPISQLMGGGPNDNPIEELRAQSVTLPTGEWLFFANDDEVKTLLKPGARLYDNPTAAATAGYKLRTLHTVTAAPGPIPRVASSKRLGTQDFRRGAFMRSTKNGAIVRFTNPDGFLIVHEGGDPVHPTIRLSRLNTDGSIAWTADTTIGRLTQVLPHDTLPAFVGELPNQLTEPVLAVVNINDGTVKTKSLKGPLN